MANTSSNSSEVFDVPSDYEDEQFTDDLVIEELPSEPAGVTPRSAGGSTPVDSFSYEAGGISISVPTGCFLNHYIEGSGKRITAQRAGVDCGGPAALLAKFCNTRIEYHYANTSNKTYKVVKGPLNTSCKTGQVPMWSRDTDHTLAHYGKACAQLFVNGKRRSVQCHYISS
ncbi:hypothetical protein [Streptomyces cyaneofuscatus]|uniref:hypothetical protein n=1 Tax=Streptomyces cyaneofuscatus TaxID=66883 RepID=UPI0033B494C6